jgi:hypothetical protein
MKLDCDILAMYLREHRKKFLLRKNINDYKSYKKDTPLKLQKILNSFDRKINNKFIFNDEIKKQYYNILNDFFEIYYNNIRFNRLSKKECYIQYQAEQYCNGYNPFSYETFISKGWHIKYKL